MNWRLITVCAIVVVLVMLLLPLGFKAVFDGHFQLTITVDQSDVEPANNLSFANCWTNEEAELAIEFGSKSVPFYPGEDLCNNVFLLDVPCSGRLNQYGHVTSYNHPKYLIVQYETIDFETVRKLFKIPEGRGDRKMLVSLPYEMVTLTGT